MFTIPSIKKPQSKCSSSVSAFTRDDSIICSQHVGNGEDTIKTLILRERADEVDGDAFESFIWDRHWV